MKDIAITETAARAKPSLMRHLTAMMYDSLLVIALIFVASALALAAVVRLTAGDQEVVNPIVGQLLMALCIFGFYSAFWLKNGQTLGMQAWRIKLVSIEDGGNISLWQAIKRCLAAILSIACLGLGFWWRLFDRNGRYWHDYLSGSELILTPKQAKRKE